MGRPSFALPQQGPDDACLDQKHGAGALDTHRTSRFLLCHQHINFSLQCARKRLECGDAAGLFAGLDFGEVSDRRPACFGELLQREAAMRAPGADRMDALMDRLNDLVRDRWFSGSCAIEGSVLDVLQDLRHSRCSIDRKRDMVSFAGVAQLRGGPRKLFDRNPALAGVERDDHGAAILFGWASHNGLLFVNLAPVGNSPDFDCVASAV